MAAIRISFLLFITGVCSVSAQRSTLTVAPLFTDNLVLQRGNSVPVWGYGVPGASVTVTGTWGRSAKGTVRPDSTWSVNIAAPNAGGPFTLSVRSGRDTLRFRNVLIGEVWLCAGQSNMEMPLIGWPPTDTIMGSAETIRSADDPMMRLFTVERRLAETPQRECGGDWKECTPEEAARFSATAYFFGKRLREELKVPVGLIVSSWGGTPVEGWTSREYIVRHPDYADFPERLEEGKRQFARYMEWLRAHPVLLPNDAETDARFRALDFGDSVLANAEYDDGAWRTMRLPGGWEAGEVGNFDGTVWYRRSIEIPRAWLGRGLVMSLGPIDDVDRTYINGKLVGGMETGSPWNVERVYSVPAGVIDTTRLVIAVRVIDNTGGGGFWGREEQMRLRPADDTSFVALSGDWKYRPVAEYRDGRFYRFDIANEDFRSRPPLVLEVTASTPTLLYNGMIAPLVPYRLRGAVWYQGESNTSKPETYRELFTSMIRNWRSDWKNDFPFYFVQIAPFAYGPAVESQRLREAQRQSLSLAGTGMAVTLDIGAAGNIHPANKEDVGGRLARWALAREYRKKVVPSGPLYRSYAVKDGSVVLSFEQSDGLRLTPQNGSTSFTIAGDDSVFHPAVAVVKGKTVIVSSPLVRVPLAVRYAWENVPEATLFNGAGLPASSFRTDDWK
ncbi:MAG: glycosyl hydrolase family 2 [Bacteroidetes bacterium]|nr:MAG: glycosyl hydrolase family 2 [Bacteroidota bacterium]